MDFSIQHPHRTPIGRHLGGDRVTISSCVYFMLKLVTSNRSLHNDVPRYLCE